MSHLISIFEHHSYLILFFSIVLELLALPVSGEFLMSYAGYFVYQGKMSYILAILTAFAAGGIGITLTYWIGKMGGYKLIERYGRYVHLGPKNYEKTASWFERSGKILLLFAYFIPGVRHLTGYVAGISKMPFRTFIVPAYIGASLWAFCFITLGKLLGHRWEDFHKLAGRYFVDLIIILAIFFVFLAVYRIFRNQIKAFLKQFLRKLTVRFHTIRKTEIFLILLFLSLLGMIVLMFGLAQDYLNNEFSKFNEITAFIMHIPYLQ
ncbi:DedA family protein [Metabacillus sp. RGM 3146]|uniref:DedA family protein n=1 Tax=Metabacillus sp. RGM 3146 TaxID=3401092 RepID=UPI003B9A44B1